MSEPKGRPNSPDAPHATYQVFDGRRWRGPFRFEELPAQGLHPDCLIKVTGAAVPSRADVLPELQALLTSNVPLARRAAGASLAYRGARSGRRRWQAGRGWAFASAGSAGAAWAAVLPLAEGAPRVLRHRVLDLWDPWVLAVVGLVLTAVACGTVGLTNPSTAKVARAGRICAWMTPNFLYIASCLFIWFGNPNSHVGDRWPEVLVFGFGIYVGVVMAIDTVLDWLTGELRERFGRQ